MKIRELHLRNIASIEKADIDFEKDLNDGVTGTPASVFLICGDTGAGKSIILDGIAMALYKKTPRISGATNTNNNEFTDTEGESIRVGSIEQYTRLGISDKDDCYSEVAFTGNDGVEYRAKLSLGMLLGTTDNKTQRRPLKHRSPKWEIKIGSGDWSKDNVEQTILGAVGLDFAQFGRMAMLAQGQFAEFLTGDRTKRADILEKLTKTGHFTSYGMAIKSLFDQAKNGLTNAQTAFNTEAGHTLPQDKVDELTAERDNLQDRIDDLRKKNDANEAKLSQVTIIESNRKAKDEEGEELERLQMITLSKEYQDYMTLISGWEATSNERHKLSDRKVAETKLDIVYADVRECHNTFQELIADLQFRRNALASQGDPQKAVDEKQAEIDALTGQLDSLDLEGINRELSQLSEKKAKISALATRGEQLAKDETAVNILKGMIADGERVCETKRTELESIQNNYQAAKDKFDAAEKRYATMSTGVQDAMVDIRRRLVEEKAERCPLCGQHIREIHLDEEFQTLLTPLEKERQECAAALENATRERDTAKTAFNVLKGTIEAKKEELGRKEDHVKNTTLRLGKDAAQFGIDINLPLKEQIEAVQSTDTRREEELRAAQERAEIIQSRINVSQKAKKPLDVALGRYTAAKRTIEDIEGILKDITRSYPEWEGDVLPKEYPCQDITGEWRILSGKTSSLKLSAKILTETVNECDAILSAYYSRSGKTEDYLAAISARESDLEKARTFIKTTDENRKSKEDAVDTAGKNISKALEMLGLSDEKDVPQKDYLLDIKKQIREQNDDLVGKFNIINANLIENSRNMELRDKAEKELEKAKARFNKWNLLNGYFGGSRFRNLVQTYILRPLLNNANLYLEKISKRYILTCSEDNEQLSILVRDHYNKDQIRSVTVLSGGERFMISLALSLALSSLNRPDMNVNILFIDEGFGTLDEKSLDSVMETIERLQEIAGQSERRVGIISHREELDERIPVKIQVKKKGEGRSCIEIKNTL